MINFKHKNLHNIIIEGCNIQTYLRCNLNSKSIGIYTTYTSRKIYRNEHKNEAKDYRNNHKQESNKYRKDHPKIMFLGKQVLTNLSQVKSGYVRHHTIYDHLNMDDYIIEMTRSEHGKLHRKMQKEGIEIPHINVRINDVHGF